MDYMVSLHVIEFISWGVLDHGPLYCITLWHIAWRASTRYLQLPPEILSVTRHVFLCINKTFIQAFSGDFEQKSGANVTKLYVGSEDVIGLFLEGVLILKIFESINSEFKKKDGCNILKS
jgi:hypothetical protein